MLRASYFLYLSRLIWKTSIFFDITVSSDSDKYDRTAENLYRWQPFVFVRLEYGHGGLPTAVDVVIMFQSAC